MRLTELLKVLSALSTPAIFIAAAVHLVLFVLLWVWYRHHLQTIALALEAFTRELKNRSVLGAGSHLTDQIDAFLADVQETLENPSRGGERASLAARMHILDEKRDYLHSLWFETWYNVFRTMIEAYPLAGVLGTILALGVVLQGDVGGGEVTVQNLVARFGEAIWSTFAGLLAAIVLMFLNSLVEAPFTRLIDSRRQVRETVSRAKRAIALAGEAGSP